MQILNCVVNLQVFWGEVVGRAIPEMGNCDFCGWTTSWRAQGERLNCATSKPAPFAEKKIAKDAAPANSIRGLIELRRQIESWRTRRHLIAVVSFDSKPRIAQDFTDDTAAAAKTIANLNEGDQGAAILDALNFGIDLLLDVPPRYRRAVLLVTETADRGSETSLDDAVRSVSDTNTAIYSFGFSTTKAAVKHEASKLPLPGGTPYGNEPYGAGGCMSLDPGADPDAHGNRRVQALDCASDLLPPLRLVRMAFIAAKEGLKRNVPESVAHLTGGEYFAFTNAATLKRGLLAISNDVPNYYVLSFRPESPSAGLHTLQLTLKDRPEVQLRARNTYWLDAEASVAP